MTCTLGDFGPAPDGVDYCENKNGNIIGPVVMFMIIGPLAVAVRLFCRYSVHQNTMGGFFGFLALDDYFLLAALTLAMCTGVCCFVGVSLGGGQHLWSLSFEKFNDLWKTLFAFIIIYVSGVSMTKTSILLFYYRLFNTNPMWWFSLFLVVGYFFSIIITACVSCRPLSFFWTQYTDPTAIGTCIDTPKFFFANGVCAMLIDVLILTAPLPTIYKLNMAPAKKALVAGILLLGSFVCVASIVRIIALHKFTQAADVVWTMADVFVWSCCEPFVGIICACLPTYGPLLARFKWFRGGSGRSNEGASGGPNLSGGKELITIGGSRMLAGGGKGSKVTSNSKGWSRISNATKNMSQQQQSFRTRPDEDEIELTATVHGGHVGSGRSAAQTSDSDGVEESKNMQVLVQRDMNWQVEYKK